MAPRIYKESKKLEGMCVGHEGYTVTEVSTDVMMLTWTACTKYTLSIYLSKPHLVKLA
jgi:hypothetical protein